MKTEMRHGFAFDQIWVKLDFMATRDRDAAFALGSDSNQDHTRPTMPVPVAPRPEIIDESGVFQAVFTEQDVLQRIGGFDRTPLVRMTPDQIRTLPLDPACAFLIGQMDGMMTIEMLIDLAPIPKEDVLRSLCMLVDHGVITVQ